MNFTVSRCRLSVPVVSYQLSDVSCQLSVDVGCQQNLYIDAILLIPNSQFLLSLSARQLFPISWSGAKSPIPHSNSFSSLSAKLVSSAAFPSIMGLAPNSPFPIPSQLVSFCPTSWSCAQNQGVTKIFSLV